MCGEFLEARLTGTTCPGDQFDYVKEMNSWSTGNEGKRGAHDIGNSWFAKANNTAEANPAHYPRTRRLPHRVRPVTLIRMVAKVPVEIFKLIAQD